MSEQYPHIKEQDLYKDDMRYVVGKLSDAARTLNRQEAIDKIVELLGKFRQNQGDLLPDVFEELELKSGALLDVGAQANLKAGMEAFAKKEMDDSLKDKGQRLKRAA